MKKLLQQALDALENSYPTPTYQESTSSMFERRRKAIAALKAELEKSDPEPIGEIQAYNDYGYPWKRISGYEWALAEMPIGAKVYAAPTEPNCKFPTCHSQEYQNKLVQEILGQEPVAWLSEDCFGKQILVWGKPEYDDQAVPLYTKGTT